MCGYVIRAAVVACLLAVGAGAAAAPAAAQSDIPRIRVLSNRADLISGGDALVEVVPPAGTDARRLKVRVGARDVTRQFAVRPNGRFQAVLRGLANGSNVVLATAPGGGRARLTIVNHPNGGPVTAGAQIQPWRCNPGASD